MEACISDNQDKLSGERPARRGEEQTEAQKADQKIIDACLNEKGISKPKGRPGGPPPGPPPEESESNGIQ